MRSHKLRPMTKAMRKKVQKIARQIDERERRKREVGLYQKFRVTRTDGKSRKGQKHHGCEYFVLDLTHDRYAIVALGAYAAACRDEYPALARDLLSKLKPWESPA